MGTIFAIAAGVLAVAAIAYVWRSLVTNPSTRSDGTPGSVMDDGDVRRIDMGSHAYAAQQAQAELSDAGLTTRLVTLESGAFGIGMGENYYLVYNADDEAQVRTVVDRLLDGIDDPWDHEQGADDLADEASDEARDPGDHA